LLPELAAPGDLVLIKGSRLARTEQVIEAFRNPQSKPPNRHDVLPSSPEATGSSGSTFSFNVTSEPLPRR